VSSYEIPGLKGFLPPFSVLVGLAIGGWLEKRVGKLLGAAT